MSSVNPTDDVTANDGSMQGVLGLIEKVGQ